MIPLLRNALALAVLMTVATTFGAHGETREERGAYLVKSVAACAGCHTPKAPPGPALSGGPKFGSGQAAVYAPNITPDRETGIGTWSDRQIIDAIRLGIRPDGSHIEPPMPQEAYRGMSDTDAMAIAAYLKGLTPIHHAVPRAPHGEAPAALPPPALLASAPVPDDQISQGRYIANALAHCTECHTPGAAAVTDSNPQLDKGGRVFRGPWGTLIAPSITAESLRIYTDEQLATIITKGVRPDGSALIGPMPVTTYAGLKPADLAAIIAYLRGSPRNK